MANVVPFSDIGRAAHDSLRVGPNALRWEYQTCASQQCQTGALRQREQKSAFDNFAGNASSARLAGNQRPARTKTKRASHLNITTGGANGARPESRQVRREGKSLERRRRTRAPRCSTKAVDTEATLLAKNDERKLPTAMHCCSTETIFRRAQDWPHQVLGPLGLPHYCAFDGLLTLLADQFQSHMQLSFP